MIIKIEPFFEYYNAKFKNKLNPIFEYIKLHIYTIPICDKDKRGGFFFFFLGFLLGDYVHP